MKPAAFEYHAPDTVDEAVAVLAEHGDSAKLLAGGQSLVPLMNFRLARPGVVVDLNRVDGLAGVRADGAGLAIGAMTRQRRAEMSSLVRERSPLLAEALGLIGHTAIRTRGTVGGSIAHADPAAELPAAVLALDAAMVCRGPDGERVTSAREFFVDYLTTALESHEVLTEIRLPPWTERSGWSFMEVSRRHGDFAMVGVACTVHVDTNGRFDDARLVLVGVGPTPHESVVGRHALIDREPSEALFLEVQRIVSADAELRPEGDIHASATYRREVAGVLAKRALRVAVARASS